MQGKLNCCRELLQPLATDPSDSLNCALQFAGRGSATPLSLVWVWQSSAPRTTCYSNSHGKAANIDIVCSCEHLLLGTEANTGSTFVNSPTQLRSLTNILEYNCQGNRSSITSKHHLTCWFQTQRGFLHRRKKAISDPAWAGRHKSPRHFIQCFCYDCSMKYASNVVVDSHH